MPEIKLSNHRKGRHWVGFKKFVGGRNFHLGPDRNRAERIARTLIAKWKELRQGGNDWTDELVRACFAVADQPSAPTPATDSHPAASVPLSAVAPPAPSPPMPAGGMTLYEAIDRYKAHERQRSDSNRVEVSTANSNRDRIDRAKRGIADMPLSKFRREELDGWIAYWTGRPILLTGRKGSATFASNICRVIHYFLDYCDVHEFWTPCRRWEDAFKRTSERTLMTALEKKQKGAGFPKLTLHEVQIIWKCCVPDMQALFGLALWCGHTQKELATIMLDDFIEKNGELYLDRNRNKTGVHGVWWIPPEVAVLVRKRVRSTPKDAKRNPKRLAFLTIDGMPLVHGTATDKQTRSDSVALAWRTVRREVTAYGVRDLSFKYLRKTSAQLVRDRLGRDYAQLFCAQVQTSVQDQNYTHPLFDRLEACVRDIYAEWKRMFEPVNLAACLHAVKAAQQPAA